MKGAGVSSGRAGDPGAGQDPGPEGDGRERVAVPAQPAGLRPVAAAALAAAFAFVALLNSGGYQYGVSDQAFYLPAVVIHLHPDFFPRDRDLIAAENSLSPFTAAIARTAAATGVGLPWLFLGGFAVTLLALAVGLLALGGRLYRSPWTVAALLAVATLRHRITLTGANTLEGYFHPRTLAFAAGVFAVVAVLRGRAWLAAAVVALAAFLHPTTGLWFACWVGVAVIVAEPRARVPFAAAAAAAGSAAAWLVFLGPMRHRLAVIDPAWRAVLGVKDYLFPTGWPLFAWFANLGLLALIVAIYAYRRRIGLAAARESGLVAGAAALVALFLASLPFVARRVALAVQLQVPRVFWMVDLWAAVYLAWLLVESPLASRLVRRRRSGPAVVVALLAAAAAGRGAYVMLAEHPGRPLVRVQLAAGPWQDALAWVGAHTPPGAHVLADPGHAWRYGTSVRVGASRDVLLEEVKDAALALYSRDVALRVADRIEAIGDFQQMTPARARVLAVRYGLDYLVAEQRLDLPVVHQNERFRVYRLEASGSEP